MAFGNFPACLKITLTHEGGWSDHPADPGGATMKGVTIGRYREYYPNATKADLRAISETDLQRIYRNDYWNKVRGDDLPFGVDLATFDGGVNSGPSRGVKWLQAAVGVKQDGVAGPATVKAALLADGKATVQRLCAKRLSFVRALKTWATFGKGWGRRIADIEARGVAMWLSQGKPLSEKNRQELEAEAGKAASKAKTQEKATGASGAGAGAGVGAGGTDTFLNGEINWIVVAAVAALVIGAVVLAVKSRQNRERQKAYVSVAAG